MIYFFNAQGTTVGVKSEPIYQGSANANSLVVVAPFSNTAVVSVAYTLPNGLGVVGGVMTILNYLGDTPLVDANGNKYNAWQIDIEAPVTQYAGVVQVQFTFNLGYGETLKSYATQFVVEKGVPSDLPPFNEIENANNLYQSILNYIASINENVVDATDKAISYVRYITNDEYILNAENAENIALSVVPTNAQYKGNFTLLGMTEYLTENQIQNPALDSNADDLFFQLQTNVGANQGGFVVDLGSLKDVGMVQMYAWSIWQNLTMKAYVSTDGDTYTLADTITFSATASSGTLDIFRFNIYQNCRYIKIVQEDSAYTNGSYACKGIQIFAPNVDGYYRIVQNNGNVIEIDSFNANTLIDIVKGIEAQAQEYSEQAKESEENAEKWAIGTSDSQDPQYNNSAKDWAESITRLAGQKGGYPILEEIGGSPKIPSVYINLATDTTYITIQSEEDLHTTENISKPTGTIARLVIDIDGEDGNKVVTKSFAKLGDGDEWALWGASYADNASNALYSEESTNALKVNGVSVRQMTQAEYNEPTTNKNGIVFVTID